MKPLFQTIKDFKIEKTNDKNPCDTLINEFKNKINNEREKQGWKYKKGERWIKLKPISFMAVKMKLYAIRNNEFALQTFLTDCNDYANRKGSFSKCFNGATRVKLDK